MLAKVYSAAVVGLEPSEVIVEVDVAERGFPGFTIVGLPTKAVEEARERVRTAIMAAGIEFPQQKITVNLAPGDVPKEGTCYDVPIAVGILAAMREIVYAGDKYYMYGELGLDGTVRSTRGALLLALLAKEKHVRTIYVPALNAAEAAVIEGVTVYPVDSLSQIIAHFHSPCIQQYNNTTMKHYSPDSRISVDFSDIYGQESAKRALEITAAGGHNLFMVGPPGAGKTMLARALPGVLPPLSEREALEVTKLYSITGNIPAGQGLMWERPFRSPHHTTSRIGLIGGGSIPHPGEISLAHRGVLFLDEFPEFPRSTLEALRQPLEDGTVSIVRVSGTIRYPTACMLVASANPCPCGYLNHPKKHCTCLPTQVVKYQKRVSGPMMDRFDLQLAVPPVAIEKLKQEGAPRGEPSVVIRKRIAQARLRQQKRFSSLRGVASNSDMGTREIKQFCHLSAEPEQLLQTAAIKYNLSARTYYRIIKVARTIADLAQCEEITPDHIAESIQYRIRL